MGGKPVAAGATSVVVTEPRFSREWRGCVATGRSCRPCWHHRRGGSKRAVAGHPALRLTEANPVESMAPGVGRPP